MSTNRPTQSLDGLKPSNSHNQSQPGESQGRKTPEKLPQIEDPLPPVNTSDDPNLTPPAGKRLRRLQGKKRWLRYALIALIVGAVLAGGIFWFLQSSIIVKNLGQGSALLQGEVDPKQLKGEGDGRVNILLIGMGGAGHQAGNLSDSMILVSIDPVAKSVAMLSIPRDLFVDIPDYGAAKINAAHAYGEDSDYPGGGPALLSKTIEQTLDVPIHYYARADFEGFREAIDAVGGIKVDVTETIDDYQYPDDSLVGYDHFYLEAGEQSLDGSTALKYARSRYSTSDFDRSLRQQKVLLALKDKAFSLGTATNPVKVAALLKTLGNNTQTNLQLDEIMRLVELGKEVNSADIRLTQLDTSTDNFLIPSTIYGQSALVPTAGDFSEIKTYVRGLLVDGYIKDEAAKISILNGTTKSGLATSTSELLRSYGYIISKTDNASDQNYTQTVIFDYGNNKPYTIQYLERRFGVTAQRRTAPEGSTVDIEIVIGSDYDPTTE